MGFKHILRETFMSTIFRQNYFPWVHKKKLRLYVLPGKKIRTQKKKLVGVPNCFVAVIEHPMTMIGIQPMLHELAHVLAFSKVYHILQGLYILKQFAWGWNKTFSNFWKEYEFIQSMADLCNFLPTKAP